MPATEEVEETVRIARGAGLQIQTREYENYTSAGLDLLVSEVIWRCDRAAEY
jgi:hypothetical protein